MGKDGEPMAAIPGDAAAAGRMRKRGLRRGTDDRCRVGECGYPLSKKEIATAASGLAMTEKLGRGLPRPFGARNDREEWGRCGHRPLQKEKRNGGGEMAIRMKRRIFSGDVCEQFVYNAPDGCRVPEKHDPEKIRKERFKTEESYEKFRDGISRRNHARNFNAAFSPTSLYSTLTFDDEHEVHTFEDARRVRDNYWRRLTRVYPDAVIFLYMGRGKSTDRIHFHMVSEGIPKEYLLKKWKEGRVTHVRNLREHNYYNGVDCGQDYTGLANYLFDHWTPEQGGHRWKQTRNAPKPEYEEPTEVKLPGGYNELRTPRAPRGYKLTEVVAPEGYELIDTAKTKYGFYYYKYVRVRAKEKKKE